MLLCLPLRSLSGVGELQDPVPPPAPPAADGVESRALKMWLPLHLVVGSEALRRSRDGGVVEVALIACLRSQHSRGVDARLPPTLFRLPVSKLSLSLARRHSALASGDGGELMQMSGTAAEGASALCIDMMESL